jgi:hypothetical protein
MKRLLLTFLATIPLVAPASAAAHRNNTVRSRHLRSIAERLAGAAMPSAVPRA